MIQVSVCTNVVLTLSHRHALWVIQSCIWLSCYKTSLFLHL